MKLLEWAATLWRKSLARRHEKHSSDSSTWPVADAIVYSCEAGVRGRMAGVQISYEYHAEEDHWSGSNWILFPDQKSSQAYAAWHPAGCKIRICYCPGDAGRSVMLESPNANGFGVSIQRLDLWSDTALCQSQSAL